MVQPNYEEYNFKMERSFFKQTEVECKLNATMEVKNIVSVAGTATSIGEEPADDGIRFSGRAVFYILYETTEGELAKTECGVEFTDKTDGADGAVSVKYASYTVQNAEVKYVNGGYVVQAMVLTEIVVENASTVSFLTGGEGILCDTLPTVFKYPAEKNRSILQIDEEFDVNYQIKNILAHSVTACIDRVQSGIGEIIIDGTIFLSMTVLQNNENNVIVKEQKNIPFRSQLEMSGASPEMQASSHISVAKCALKVVVDEDRESSTVIASVDLDAFGCVYAEKDIPLVRDAYSPLNEVEVKFDSGTQQYISAEYVLTEKVSGEADLELGEGEKVVFVSSERAEGLNHNVKDGVLTGIISASAVIKGENGYRGQRVTVPFEISLNSNENTEYKFLTAVENFTFKLRSSLEIDATLRIFVIETVTENYKAVADVVVGEEKQPNTNAISVYIPRPGDMLWSVCKELGVSAEVITELNPDVEFPLTGTERIIVYRKI